MELNLFNADIFTNTSEAIAFSIDGTAPGMEGRLARHFERLHPTLWKKATSHMKFPLSLGDVFTYRFEVPDPYKMLCAAYTLNHIDNLTEKEITAVVYTAFRRVLSDCLKHSIKSLACTPMTGGFRLDCFNAFLAMWQAVENVVGYHKPLEINVYIKTENDYNVINNHAINTHILD